MKKLIFLFILPFFTSTGDTFPASGTNDASLGNVAWLNPGNILADDGVNSVCHSNSSSQYLVASNFGFSIPSSATILGVTVKVEMKEDRTFSSIDFRSQLQDASGALFGTGKLQTIENGGVFTIYTYGGTSDLWGATLTPTIINDADFGVRFWYTHIGDSVSVDYITMAVEYSNRRAVVIN